MALEPVNEPRLKQFQVKGREAARLGTLMPAFEQALIEEGTVTFGGSIKEISPKNVSSVIWKLNFSGSEVSKG